MPYLRVEMLRNVMPQLVALTKGPYLRSRLWSSVLLCIFLIAGLLGLVAPIRYSHEEILQAIWMTESSGSLLPADGDDGKAIGPFQIHEVYWIDSEVPGTYQDCRDRQYAERVVRAYMQRYAADAWRNCDAEIIARTHNGGPQGRFKRATDRYWQRVSEWLVKLPRHPDPDAKAMER